MKKGIRKRYELTETQKILLRERTSSDCSLIARKLGVTRQYVNDVLLGKYQNLKVWNYLAKLTERRATERAQLNAAANKSLVEQLIAEFVSKASGVLQDEEVQKQVAEMRTRTEALIEELRAYSNTLLNRLQDAREQAEADWREAQNREAV